MLATSTDHLSWTRSSFSFSFFEFVAYSSLLKNNCIVIFTWKNEIFSWSRIICLYIPTMVSSDGGTLQLPFFQSNRSVYMCAWEAHVISYIMYSRLVLVYWHYKIFLTNLNIDIALLWTLSGAGFSFVWWASTGNITSMGLFISPM